jgi:DNA-binding MarR family transcriptional regulator
MPKFIETPAMLLRGAYLTMHRRFNAHFDAHGITADQFVLLSLLRDQPGCTQRELAELSFADPNTITAMSRLLERRGLIVRERDPADARVVRLNLTASGRALRTQCAQSAQRLHATLDACVPVPDRPRFAAALMTISEIMRDAEATKSTASAAAIERSRAA